MPIKAPKKARILAFVMDGCYVEKVAQLAKASRKKATKLLEGDKAPAYILTRSLLNLVWNAVKIGSLSTKDCQRNYFNKQACHIFTLLNKSISLKKKHQLFLQNPRLAKAIANLCPAGGL